MIFVIVAYLILWGVVDLLGIALLATCPLGDFTPFKVGSICALAGGLGGILYCLRAVYLNVSVRDSWDPKWHAWYFLRPITSIMCGAASYIFLKAGLIILESSTQANSSDFGFYAFAIIAGLNVDKFVKKLEDVAEVVWGIEKSRAASLSSSKEEK